MHIKDYEKLKNVEEEKEVVIGIHNLTDKSDRTLLYGYTCERESWHIYIKDGEIHAVIYPFQQKIYSMTIEKNHDYVPDKRLYPEKCDYEFCVLLKQKGIYLPFTTWSEQEETKKYYGETL